MKQIFDWKPVSLAIVVPAWNAERTIERCLIAAQRQNCFLIVIDDYSTDGTNKIAAKYADLVINNSERKGKAQSLNELANWLQHEYMLVVDADTYLQRRFVEYLETALRVLKADCGSGRPHFIGTTKFSQIVAEMYNALNDGSEWRYNGCCQFFKTEFLRVHPLSTSTLIEDEELHWRLIKQAKQEQQSKPKQKGDVSAVKAIVVDVFAHTETPHSPSEVYRQSLRWTRGAMQLVKEGLMPKRLGPIPIYSIISITSITLILPIGFSFGAFMGSLPLLAPLALLCSRVV